MVKSLDAAKAAGEQQKIQQELAQIFTPGVPIANPELFSGRQDLLDTLGRELLVTGRNFVLYGERGVGKTSFYNVLLNGLAVERHNCSKQDDFVTIFLNILSKRGEQFTAADQESLAKMGYKIGDKLPIAVEGSVEAKAKEIPVAQRRLDLNFVLNKLRRLERKVQVIVLDEFHNIESDDVQTGIIEVVKGLSDEKISIKLVLVGIAESDTDLLTSPEYPQYKGRHFVATRIPRMNREELADIIYKRERLFHIKFAKQDVSELSRIAAGYPQFAHDLALSACMAWLVANFAAVFAHWVDKFPLLGLVARPFLRSVTVESIEWDITARDLNQAVTRLAKQFETNEPAMSRRLKDSMAGNDPPGIRAALGLLATTEADDVGIDEIRAGAHLSAEQVRRLFRDDLDTVVENRDGRYRLRIPTFRAYILSCEYLSAKAAG